MACAGFFVLDGYLVVVGGFMPVAGMWGVFGGECGQMRGQAFGFGRPCGARTRNLRFWRPSLCPLELTAWCPFISYSPRSPPYDSFEHCGLLC